MRVHFDHRHTNGANGVIVVAPRPFGYHAFALQSGDVRKLLHFLGIAARYARRRTTRHRARCAGADNRGFSPEQFGQPWAHFGHQLVNIDVIMARLFDGRDHFW